MTQSTGPVTVARLARAKGLPAQALMAVGVRDEARGITIPYCDETGFEIARKKRTAMSAKDGSFWPTGQELIAYGLWRLGEASKAGRLILVEGESDCWVLWHRGYP